LLGLVVVVWVVVVVCVGLCFVCWLFGVCGLGYYFKFSFFFLKNFVASNKYSMLPDDVDPDNIDE